jgi:hypothetical protein
MPLLSVDPDQARRDAARILRDRRYRHDPAPRPLRKPLEWLGDRLRGIGNAIADVFRAVPGPTWLAAAAAIVLVAVAVVWWLVRTHRSSGTRDAAGSASKRAATAHDDPAALEREADDAERAGDLERALRLRFRAGLLRLDARGAIRYRPSLTTGEVRRLLGSATFDDLAARFEQVAYGREPAEPGDVAAARSNWPRVVEDASRQ